MDNSIFTLAEKHFPKEVIQANFLEALKRKGYINETKPEFCGDFLKILFKKKYVDKKTYNSILNYYGKSNLAKGGDKKSLVDIRENPLIEMVEESIEKDVKNETYEITDKEYIDYENIQIDGVEYYIHKENMNIVDVYDFRDMGTWDKGKCGIIFINNECSERHSSRVLSS